MAEENTARDSALSTRIRDNDAEAFATLFRLYYSSLVGFVYRYIPSAGDAEDIAQDAMVSLWERRHTLDPERSVRALLFTTARHRALNHLGRQRHALEYSAQQQLTQGLGSGASDISADSDLMAQELDRVAAHHVATLPPRQREIFQLSRGEGLSPTEIAALLGIAPQTVYVQLGRIAKSLYDALEAWTKNR